MVRPLVAQDCNSGSISSNSQSFKLSSAFLCVYGVKNLLVCKFCNPYCHRGQDVVNFSPRPDVILMSDVVYYEEVRVIAQVCLQVFSSSSNSPFRSLSRLWWHSLTRILW